MNALTETLTQRSPERPDRSAVADWTLAQLHEMVFNGQLAPGGDLTEMDLTARLGVSRSPGQEDGRGDVVVGDGDVEDEEHDQDDRERGGADPGRGGDVGTGAALRVVVRLIAHADAFDRSTNRRGAGAAVGRGGRR
jgi:hypothetical protein